MCKIKPNIALVRFGDTEKNENRKILVDFSCKKPKLNFFFGFNRF